MKIISIDEFYALCQQSDIKVIKHLNDKRPKILETREGQIIKIFYARKKWFASWKNKRAAIKFCKNAKRLAANHILAPHIIDFLYCRGLNVYIVTYKKLPGENIRILTRRGERDILADVAAFIAKLHQMGIFFRSLHLENLLYLGPGQIALLDITDVRFKHKSLNIFLRYRNLKHMFSIRQDQKIWRAIGFLNYVTTYFQFTNLSHFSKMSIAFLMQRLMPKQCS